jgi:3,5-epimerase/4-reductase
MNVFTIGGGFVSDHLNYPKIKDRVELSEKLINNLIDNYKPDVLINCIGRTGSPNVDWCEANKEIVASTNTALPIMLAEACAKRSIHLIQIGSGCIYFGESPNVFYHHPYMAMTAPKNQEGLDFYNSIKSTKIDTGWKEADFANPKSFYSKSKYACDLMIGSMSHVTTLRIRMPISTKDSPRNLINKLKGYKQVIDIPNSVTFMDDLVGCVDWAVKNSQTGIFHVTNKDPVTAAQVMKEYQKYVPEHKFEVITEQQLDSLTVAKRSNCLLDSSKLELAGFHMSPSVKALEDCMAKYMKK